LVAGKIFLDRTQPIPDAAALESTVFETAEPLIRRVVRWRIGSNASLQDQEDVAGDVLLELLARLDSVRMNQSEPIADFQAYAAVAANHGCDRYLRRRYPQRHRLTTRIRYLLDTSADYAVWESETGSLACGFAKRRGEPVKTVETGWARQVPLPPRATEASAVAAALGHAAGPLRLSDLVDAVALLLNVRDEVVAGDRATIASPSEDLDLRLDQRRMLERLWSEIQTLPRAQRVALLLNLRDEQGGCALTSLPATGVASIREIARMIEMRAEDLAQIWRALPLSDLQIAERLGITRQQVINLRKAARQRLTRRMSGNKEAEPPSKKETAERV
jgi:RNA polymerase sigma factor (sigma-70 family)